MPAKIKTLICTIFIGLAAWGLQHADAQGPNDYYVGHGMVDGDTLFVDSGTFWDDGYDTNYSATGDWDVYICTPDGNPYPLTLDFSGFATHYGGGSLPGDYWNYDYIRVQFSGNEYFVYHDDTPEFGLTSQDGCIRITMYNDASAITHDGWQANIYAIPPPSNNEPCGAALLTVGNVCTPQVFTNKGAFETGTYATCHDYFGGDVWFTAVMPPSGNLKIESFPGTLDWAVMNLYRGSDCSGLTQFDCIEDSIGMPTAHITSASSGVPSGDTVFIRMFGDQAKSGTFGMCASDPTGEIKGHTGPGGVGDDSTNVIWLRADKGALNNSDTEATDGQAVKTWQDQSGNSNHILQSTGSQQPLLTDNIINSRPVLRLDGTDDYMMAELSSLSAPLTLIAVSQFTASGVDNHLMSMGDEVSATKTVSISRETDDRYYSYTDAAKQYGPTLNDNTPYLIHATHNIASIFHELYINESTQSPTNYTTSVVTDGSLRLGASRNTTNFLGGDIAEFIIYKQKLNLAQKIIVENSLAAKYGISITTDRYAYETGHGYDVAGIGQVDANNQHTEAQSSATLSIGNPTDLDDNEFVLFGHDNGDISSWTSTERPNNDPNLQRITREWRVNITGDPGPLTLTLSDSILPSLLPGFNNYTLWTDTDGDFSSGATAVPLIKVDDEYVANTVSLTDGIYLTAGVVMPVVGFTQASSEGLESIEFPNIEVSLNYALNEEISVVFRAVDSTTTGGGVDYLLNPGSATFAAGTTTTNVQPQVIDDTIVEIPNEYFNVRLSDPDAGLTLSADSNHIYTILNNDINVTAATSTDTISDCGTASANLSTTVEGTGPYDYAWTPVAGLSNPALSNPEATPAADTWYKVTVTDQTNAAVETDSVHITVIPAPDKPTISTGGPTTFCEGDSVQLSASSGYSWLWSNGMATQDIYVTASGSYTVRVIDEFGCQSELSDAEIVTVNSTPATPTITPSGDTDICPGDSVDLTSSDGDNYKWSAGETTKSIRVKVAGDFYVQTQSSDGCWSDTSLITTVTIKTPPAAPTITPNGPTDLCPGDSVDLSSSAGTTYVWSTGETTSSIRVKTADSYSVRITDVSGCLSDPSANTDITIKTPPPAPTITPNGSTDFCPGDSVDLTSSAGTTYLWSTGETTSSIRVKTADSYSVRVTDVSGCLSTPSADTDVTIKTPPTAPTITPNGPTDLCPGDSVDLSSSAGTTYLWSTGETTPSIRVKTADSYSVRVTDVSGCLSAQSADTDVTINTPPAAPTITTSGPTDICPGDSVDLISGAGTTYLWSTGETTPSIRVKTADNYSVRVTDGTGCLSDPSATATVTLLSAPAAPVITSGGSTDICENDSVSLNSSAGTGYLWSTGETTGSIYAKTAGDFTVQVSNADGCWSPVSTDVTITTQPAPAKPVISFTGSTEFCEGDSLVLTSSAENTYLWSNGETTRSITVKTSDSYSVRVANPTGCLSLGSDAVDITVNAFPAKPAVTGATEYCQGDSVQLSAPAASTYLWSTGETTASIYVKSGSYTVSITDAIGCGSPTSDPHTVTENPLPAKPVISGDTEYCAGNSVQLSSPAANFYLWSTGETTQDIIVTAGTYTVVATDANGCESSSSDPHNVSENPKPGKPTVTADGPLEFWLGDSVVLSSSAANTYLWSPGAEITRELTVKTGGNYSVVIGDAKGCQSDPSDAVTVIVNSITKPQITITGDTEFCEGTSQAILESTDAFAYVWSNGETTKSITIMVSGTYSVTTFDNLGHQSEPSDPVQVSIHENPVASLLGKTDLECYGEATGVAEVTVSGGGTPYTYLWTDGQTTAQAINLLAGTHTVTVRDANLCQAILEVDILQPEAIQIEEQTTQPYCSDSDDGSIEISISGGTPSYSILWSDGSSGTMMQDLSPGTYEVEVTDANQCERTETFTLTVQEDNCVIVPEIITPNTDGYNDTWMIPGIEFYPEATVEIYDRWGKQIYFSKGYDQPWDGKYEGKLLPMASYHYVINLNNGSPALVGNITIVK